VLYGVSPVWKGFSLNARFSGLSGTRYSLLVAGDINGDFVGQTGSRNDLAFVFDLNDPSTPENLRTEMNRLLNESDSRAKDYIRESFGKIADRNGGENKQLVGVIDVRLLKAFRTFKTQSLEFSVDVFNFANLLNKDWGGNYNLGNQNLLNVSGFNQATQQYTYSVNANAGVVQKSGTPYQIQLGVRYAF
jgi:hypothetical protein